MSFSATTAAVVELFKIAGLESAADKADLNPPAVLVTPVALLVATKMCGTERMRLNVELVARDSGDATALEQIDDLWTTVEPIIARYRTSDAAVFTRTQVTNDPTALPTLRIVIETNVVTTPNP